MRMPRVKAEGAGFYHCISRAIERRYIFKDEQKEVFCAIMRKTEAFCGVQIMTYSLLSNHFHILLQVPEREEITDVELFFRLSQFYSSQHIHSLSQSLQEAREQGNQAGVDQLRGPYLARMYDLSEFMKTLKQRFSIWYNHLTGRQGPLWEDRFKSTLLEGTEATLTQVATYIDLNPVRAGLVKDPKDYRYCGYGEAVAGNERARRGLCGLRVNSGQPWDQAASTYRCKMFLMNLIENKGDCRGFEPDRVQRELDRKGVLSMPELMHCRIRYFTDGVVIGSKAFVDGVFQRYRPYLGAKRKDGARPMKFGAWDGLCTLRHLRLNVIIPSRSAGQ